MPNTQLPSKPVLKTSLEALGLPTWGSRQKMYDRLTGAADSNKPAATIKKKSCATSALKSATSKPNSASIFDAAELKFFHEERPRLIAQGITDPVRQNTELQRRYKEIQSLKNGTSTKAKAAPVPKAPANMFVSATPFSKADMKQLGLTLVSVAPDSSGTIMYNYTKTPQGKGAAAKTAAKHEEESDGDSDGDSAMDECEDIVIDRLMKLPKELLKDMCKAYGVETSGSKQDLAELVGEQLTNETGNENESDDEDDEDA